MQVTVTTPDELATVMAAPGQDPARAAVEAWAIEAYRQRRISCYQLRTLLGLASRWDLDGFLKKHKIETYTVDEWEKDWATIQEHRRNRNSNRTPAEAVAHIRESRKGITLGGASIKDLIHEGHRY